MTSTQPLPQPPAAPRPTPAPAKVLDTLPPGTRFGEFEIRGVIGMGGFGVVYLAHDHSLDRQVALKEYMPTSLAVRGEGPQITIRSDIYSDTYAAGLRSFVNEAKLLARFDHPALLKVYRFWEDHGTAYMVMPYLQGQTLSQMRRAMSQPPDEAWIRQILDALLDALEHLHRDDVYHRDVAPDNVFLPHAGSPVLLDFGAARRVIVDRTQSLTAILKPSYAPIEQYADMSAMRQGPWTDLYALGAVLHFLVFGKPPAPSTSRAVQPETLALEDQPAPHVSRRFLRIIAWMLSVRPQERPQSVQALREVLAGRAEVPEVRAHGVTPGHASATVERVEPTVPAPGRYSAPTEIDPRYQATQVQPRRAETDATPPGPRPTAGMPPAAPPASAAGPSQPATDPALAPTVRLERAPSPASAPPAPPESPAPPAAGAEAAVPAAVPMTRRSGWWLGLAVAALAAGGAWLWQGPGSRPAPSAAASAPAPAGYTGPQVGQVASVPSWGK